VVGHGVAILCIGHADIVLWLHGIGANLHPVTDQGETAFCLACSKGHEAVVRLLLGLDADDLPTSLEHRRQFGRADNMGRTPVARVGWTDFCDSMHACMHFV